MKLTCFRYYFFLIMVLPLTLIASVQQSKTTATAYGKTYQDALQQALIQSVSQVKGTDISSIYQTFDKVTSVNGMVNINGIYIPIKKYYESTGFISKINSATKGVIDSYKVTNAMQQGSLWSVTVDVVYTKYKSDSTDKEQLKPTLVVVPFSFSISSIDKARLKKQLQQSLVNAATKLNSYRVLDRSLSAQSSYKHEMNLILSDKSSPQQKARFGNQIGADYILIGNVQSLHYKKVSKNFYGTDFSKWDVSAKVNYRLLETATMQIMFSKSTTLSIPSAEVVKVLADEMKTKDDVLDMLIQKITSNISGQFLTYEATEKNNVNE